MVIYLFENENQRWGAGILPICSSTGKILVQKRAAGLPEPNTWCSFGGKGEDGEGFKDAAIREFEEESGYTGEIDNLKFISSNTKKNFKFYNYLCTVPNEFKVTTIGKKIFGYVEVADAKWLTLEELIRLDNKHPGLELILNSKMIELKKYMKKYVQKKL